MRHEARRLESLRNSALLEAAPFPELVHLCGAVRRAFDVDVAFVSAVDETHQWFVAVDGAKTPGAAPRTGSLCQHALHGADMLVIPDATLDPRVSDLDWVTGGIVRFYVGMPLSIEEGVAIGTFCIVHSKPRDFSDTDRENFHRFASLAHGLVRARAASRASRLREEELASRNVVVRKQAEDIWRTGRILEQVGRQAQLGTWEWFPEKDHLKLSAEIQALTGFEEGKVLSRADALGAFAPAERLSLRQAVSDTLRDGEPLNLDLPYRTQKGAVRRARLVGEVAFRRGRPERLFGIFHDVTEQHETAERLLHLARHDPLTGLANRGSFCDALTERLQRAERRREGAAVVVLELEDLQLVNDTQGYQVGNATLVEVAQRLGALLGPCDHLGQAGGGDFILYLSKIHSREEALARASVVVEELSHDIRALDGRVPMRCSLGVSLFPEHGRHPHALLQNADIALHRAKADGGGITIFTTAMRESFETRAGQISRFRQALASKAVEAHFQPQVTAEGQALCGFEALARWRTPDGRVRSAGEFQAALNDPRAAVALGERMMDEVAFYLRQQIDAGLSPARVSLNVSAFEFWKGDYPQRISCAFERRDVPLSLLSVEVTESVFLDRPGADVGMQLAALRNGGAEISLDDFGTGYASLSHLKSYAVDEIKIDRSFINGLGEDGNDEAIVSAIVSLARSLGIRTVAEGVETVEQAGRLKRLGCDRLQGFLFGRAIPGNEASRLLPARYEAPDSANASRTASATRSCAGSPR